MKTAKNIDSVFANCTQDELDFDLIFDKDDLIIDYIAGVDEAGIPFTGPDYDYTRILKEADMLEDIDDQEARDGKTNSNVAPEGSKEKDLKVGGEVGDGKEVSGKEKSAESEAHDMKPYESETAQSKAVQKAMEISAQKFADKSCKENAEYDGYEELIEAVIGGIMTKEEIMSENATEIAIATANYLIESCGECCDSEARDGKVCSCNKGNTEGVKSEVIDKQTKGSYSGNEFMDPDDVDSREGKAHRDNNNVEGVSTRVVGAAMESGVQGDLDKSLEAMTQNGEIEKMNREVVPDSVRVNEGNNFVNDHYKQLMVGMRSGLVNMALSECMSEESLYMAEAVCEATAIDEEVTDYSDYSEYAQIMEAFIDILPDEVIAMEGVEDLVVECVDYIIAESSPLRTMKRSIERTAEKAGKRLTADQFHKINDIAKQSGMPTLEPKNVPKRMVARAVQTLTPKERNKKKAEALRQIAQKRNVLALPDHGDKKNLPVATGRKIKSALDKVNLKDIPASALKNGKSGSDAKNLPANVSKNALAVINKAADGKDGFMKKHGKKLALAGGALAGAAGVGLAAKAIASHRKAAAKKKDKSAEEVKKESYEYPEYQAMIEAIIGDFSEEEIMAENAAEMATAIAETLIESAMASDDDADIESVASENDPKVNIQYDYDDDELIDMVVNDKEL